MVSNFYIRLNPLSFVAFMLHFSLRTRCHLLLSQLVLNLNKRSETVFFILAFRIQDSSSRLLFMFPLPFFTRDNVYYLSCLCFSTLFFLGAVRVTGLFSLGFFQNPARGLP